MLGRIEAAGPKAGHMAERRTKLLKTIAKVHSTDGRIGLDAPAKRALMGCWLRMQPPANWEVHDNGKADLHAAYRARSGLRGCPLPLDALYAGAHAQQQG